LLVVKLGKKNAGRMKPNFPIPVWCEGKYQMSTSRAGDNTSTQFKLLQLSSKSLIQLRKEHNENAMNYENN
jgi:hypothetical protein